MWGNKIKLPRNFIFKGDHLETSISVLVDFSKLIHKNLRLDFSDVREIGKGDIMVLMAQIEKTIIKKNKRIEFIGRIPPFIRSLFSETVLHFTEKNFDKYTDADKIKTVDPSIISNVSSSLQSVGIRKNSSDAYAFYERIEALLNEIIGNAIEHGIKNKDINCWLTTEKSKNSIKITFVDMGIGISRSHKKARLLLKYRILGGFGENKIILDSLYGKLPSSTQTLGRGRGLPEVREIVEKEWVSNFMLISNKTSLLYENNHFKTIKIKNFKGTYYSWTISKYNFEKWKITRLT